MQGIIQSGIETSNLQLINNNLEGVFGPTTSMFLTTTVNDYLFEGIEFCQPSTNFVVLIICAMIRTSAEASNSLRIMPDNSIRFSFFHFVSINSFSLKFH